jgi:GNAT superfamily N-acetyltransferase
MAHMSRTAISAGPGDDEQLARLIRARFHGLAPSTRLIEDPHERWEGFADAFKLDLADTRQTGRVRTVSDRSAAALWIFHYGGPEPEPLLDERIRDLMGQPPAENYLRFAQALHAAHQQLLEGRRHWHLWILAVAQDREGQGLGSLMIRDGTDLADKAGHPVYLEAANAELIEYYQRFGFEFTGSPVELGKGVQMFPMIREPRWVAPTSG